jgi:hypothetical protein
MEVTVTDKHALNISLQRPPALSSLALPSRYLGFGLSPLSSWSLDGCLIDVKNL